MRISAGLSQDSFRKLGSDGNEVMQFERFCATGEDLYP